MLHRPWLAPVVVAFWCVTTGWLLAAKVLPSLRPGTPPGYQALYSAGGRLVPVAWTVHWNGSPLGWALTDSQHTADGGIDVQNRMRFDRLPLEEILPTWAGRLVQRSLRQGEATGLESAGRLSIDPQGKLRSFHSTIGLPGSEEQVVLDGRVADGAVTINVRVGELRYEATRHLPDQMMLGDELSPQAMMPGLVEGRRWTVPVYSPLRPGTSPLQILHALVEGEENMYWGNRLVRVHLVTYREDPSSSRDPRCRLWVDRAGRVLKHESMILNAKLAFLRRTDDEADVLADTVLRQGDASPSAAASADTGDRP